VLTTRRRVKVNEELPMGDEYGAFIEQLLAENRSPATKVDRPERSDS